MNIIEKISKDLRSDSTYIWRIVNRADYYYKDYTIPKKDGKFRRICQPSPELKTLQYWVLNNIVLKLPISENAVAYKKGSSIKKNACLHVKSRHIFHSDITFFFESITISHLERILKEHLDVFKNLELDFEESIKIIGKICFRNKKLYIGAVSSPAISNAIMYSFDIALDKFCSSQNLIYTRYADDIYISSNKYITKDVLNYVNQELHNNYFEINLNKTKFFSLKYKRMVTGLVLGTDQKVYVGTERKKQIKHMLYNKLVHKKGDSNQILGYLSFLQSIEPTYYSTLLIKYSRYCDGDIIDCLRKEN